ncbi:YbgA family protein [Legionella hackeliae]|uniref:DUF1722 domain-containing protein n=1 Tax=Legionella hackeliae TaxID=449 RepID=A0A0A8UKM5_LEGHA|nr:DUF523 and DUF1722 domain-containing protein [Legionella hackeliae]KTD13437.1 hypothetical protein Lhac_0821 [Legionella hackeliae]CEK09278.1 conserved protein of unknown function [Legionella hackeliae]STX49185.1 Uncharacterized conserved protein [Legionella hackeliae]
MTKNLVIGISSCLIGERVRFDGGHKRDHFICDLLANYVDFTPICPEVAIGLGIPRPAIQLRGDPDNPKLVNSKDHAREYTSEMLNFSRQAMPQLTEISGYILKSKSPSCGLKRVKIYQEHGKTPLHGQGLFARTLQETYPSLPIEEEGRLQDYRLRENFIERIFIYNEWQTLTKSDFNANKLVKFHTRHKLTLMAHSPATYKLLGQKVAELKKYDLESLAKNYIHTFMQGMSYLATPKKHTNVLEHCLGYFKKQLAAVDKQELIESIYDYRSGLLPLIVPVTLLNHHLKHYPQPYLSTQSYLNPYPKELMLRNHI